MIHVKKNIFSFNKCKLDTMWPINRLCLNSNQVKKIFAFIISLKKIFSAIHQKKKHILKCTKDSKNNQSIFKSSSVPKLAKCMHVMCENNERYDCRIARWI